MTTRVSSSIYGMITSTCNNNKEKRKRYLARMAVKHMVLNYKGSYKYAIDN